MAKGADMSEPTHAAPILAIILAMGALLFAGLYAICALAEAALPVLDQIMNWGV